MKKKLLIYSTILLLLTITNVARGQNKIEDIKKRTGDSIKQVFMTQTSVNMYSKIKWFSSA
ncbi:exported protein of unknown function [Chryseobacterium sp. JV274]|nr:exported protein of unknown function [Chryseobacterium sp. JV274]